MGAWPKWRHIVEASKHEALEAVDHYNRPLGSRGLEGFFVHMHIAWLYLLQAEMRRQGVDDRYRLTNGRFDRIDGEPKRWDLTKCVRERFADNDPVRKNLELTIALRNQIEHRYSAATNVRVAGHAHAMLVNYEDELTAQFGSAHSLAGVLRFPVFIANIGSGSQKMAGKLLKAVPKKTQNLIARFEADLGPEILDDQRYEFRLLLTRKTGPRTEADLALDFVREDELDEDQRQFLEDLGRRGTVIVRERLREVANHDCLRPKWAATEIEAQLAYRFTVSDFVIAYRTLKIRPPTGDAHPERTEEKYCVYDPAHGDYVYKPAFITKVVREVNTVAKYEAFLGKPPTFKISELADRRSAS